MNEVKMIDIEELTPYMNNARIHSEKQISKIRSSIREFGFTSPILIDGNYNVLAGHGRLKAAKLEGLEQVPCIMLENLTETQKKAYILADNRIAEEAIWNNDILAYELEELQNADFDLLLTGFSNIELNNFLSLDDDIIENFVDVETNYEQEQTSAKSEDVLYSTLSNADNYNAIVKPFNDGNNEGLQITYQGETVKYVKTS